MKIKACLLLFVAAAVSAVTAVFSVGLCGVNSAVAVAEQTNSLQEAVTDSPLFYGATGITLPVGNAEDFSVSDSRFRIFARDCFGLDLTPDIRVTHNDVNAGKVGNYSVKYEVFDSRQNRAEITVPVAVVSGGDEFIVERTVYAVPAMENMKKTGLERCNAGDRQILGIYAPDDSSFSIMPLSDGVRFEITFFTDNRGKNSFQYVNAGETDYKRISNLSKDGSVYGAVPLITSPRLATEDTSVTYKISLKFDSAVKPLDYYRYKDDESAFKAGWKESENAFAVVDGEAMLVVVPFCDINSLTGEKTTALNVPFSSLDEFFEYYKEVVDRFDIWAGLSFAPKYATDKNYRTKYTAAADSYGATVGAAAYYGGGFIATGSKSAAGFFRYGWGTLHEIAHGYQGSFGKGIGGGYNMGLNETGNNIFAYYIQNDRALYKGGENWLGGGLKEVEERLNAKRINNQSVFNNDGGTYTNVQEKLYCLINLFNAFEGPETYGKLFSYYRRVVERGASGYTAPDVYAEFFASEYGADVTPYLYAWGMKLSPELTRAVRSQNLTAYYIADDLFGGELSESVGENFNLNYAPYKEAEFEKFGVTGNLTVTVAASNECLSELENKNVGLFYKGELKAYAAVSGGEITFNGLKAGAYEARFPALDDYRCSNTLPVTVRGGENAVGVEYVYDGGGLFYPVNLTIRGVHGTTGFALSLNSENSAKVTLGGADLGNRNDEWKNKPDQTYASVTVYAADESVIEKYEVKGNGYFSDLKGLKTDLNLTVGAKIDVYAERPQGVKVNSLIGGEEIADFLLSDKLAVYKVTEFGLALDGDEAGGKEALIAANKAYLIKTVEDYVASVSEKELQDKTLNADKKREVLKAYNALSEEDKASYSEVMSRVSGGGKPIIKTPENTVSVYGLAETNLYSLISVTDSEDLVITPNKSNTSVKTEKIDGKTGEYAVTIIVTDSDGNVSEATAFVKNLTEIKAAESIGKRNGLYAAVTVGITVAIFAFGIFKAVKDIIKEG